MTRRKCKRKNISVFSILFIILVSTLFIFSISHNQIINFSENDKNEGSEYNIIKKPQLGAQETLTAVWLENPDFEEDPIEPTWYSELEGELSDVDATTSPGQVNNVIRGDSNVKRIDEELSYTYWDNSSNPLLPIKPDVAIINSSGCYVSHLWHENINQTRNRPSFRWKRVIEMDVNMTHYIITSASLEVIFNATVTVDPHAGGGIDRENDLNLDAYSTGDYVKFYALLSDEEETIQPIQIATNNTGAGNLGADGPPYNPARISNFTDSQIDTIPEGVLIDALNTVLEVDDYNFTITLGIDIYCEDNELGVDIDSWDELIIRSFNLTFTYEKKIEPYSSVSWNQDGDKISDISNDTIIINEAKLNFKYQSNYNWTEEAPNSEIQVFINNNKLSKTIKLLSIEANRVYQFSTTDGYDVTSVIPYNSDINFSIRVYLADSKEFSLDRNITFSIDDVYLNITYTVEFPDQQTNLQVFFNGVNKTSSPLYDHPVGYDLNITVKYPNATGGHISGALVELSGNLTGILVENQTLEQYTIIIDTNDLDVGTYQLKIIAHKINHKISRISSTVTVLPYVSQNLQLFLNGENRTLNPLFDISLDKLLNITIKYYTNLGTPVKEGTVSLSGEGIIENLNESVVFNQYSVILNTSSDLKEGDNPLTIEASKLNHETKFKDLRISVRKINSLITPVNNTVTIESQPGGDALIQVYINNTDFNELMKGVIVAYTWDSQNGFLNDLDNDGIYELNLTDIPAGTHSIIINAYGDDKYNFVSLEMIVAAIPPADTSFIFRILLTLAVIASIALAGYVYAYQKVLKFPRTVRKVRKYRRTLQRTKAPKLSIFDRKKAFDSVYQKELISTTRFLKVKTKEEEKEEKLPEKVIKKTPENSEVNVPSKPSNQNMNSYNIVGKKNNRSNVQIPFRTRFKKNLRKKWTASFKINNSRKFLYLITILVSLTTYSLIINHKFDQNSIQFSENSSNFVLNEDVNNLGMSAQQSFTKQWLNNTSFDDPIQPTWYPSYGVVGDNKDVNAINSSGQVNFTVIGDSGKLSIHDLSDANWTDFNNPEFPIEPTDVGINGSGCYISHTWDESVDQSLNTPSIHWKRNVSMDVNMSDYKITSASLITNYSAFVQALDHDGGGVEVPGDYTEGQNPPADTQFGIGDFVTFYVEISDLENSFSYRIASNRTKNLGQDTPIVSNHTDVELNVIPKKLLISYLTSCLKSDDYNFTITLGIDVYCEDNEYNTDLDRFRLLAIDAFNLTFTYEKKIDRFTTVSWNQDADKISDLCNENETAIVNEAILNFKYKTNQNWTNISPNSEIRILFNDNQHSESIKLSNGTDLFEDAKIGGFDVTPLIIDEVNLSIQVYLADEFGLADNITISIDDVTLNITYTIISPDIETDLYLFLNGDDRTNNPIIDINIGDSLNITINYFNATGAHIPNATVYVLGNFTGDLEEDEILEQYSIIINTDLSNAGSNFITILAQAEDHDTKEIIVQINVNKFPSDNLQIFLNNQDVTPDPYIKLIKNDILNISVKYITPGASHISGASVLLTSEPYSSYLNESSIFKHYYTIINITEWLAVGETYFTIEAQSDMFQTQNEEITVSIRKINLEIVPLSGENTIETRTGESIRLHVRINNTDIGEFITGAFVSYIWEGGSGILTDENNDGIYEDTISDFPEGTYNIEISALVGDDYFIENYEMYASATSEEAPENIIFPVLLGVSIAIISGMVIYLYAYYTYLKFPKQVRKVRKYRKTLKRNSAPNIGIMDRESAFKKKYRKEIRKASKVGIRPKFKKPASSEQEPITDIATEKPIKQKIIAEKLIKEVVEKKEELDKLVDKSLDENTNPSN